MKSPTNTYRHNSSSQSNSKHSITKTIFFIAATKISLFVSYFSVVVFFFFFFVFVHPYISNGFLLLVSLLLLMYWSPNIDILLEIDSKCLLWKVCFTFLCFSLSSHFHCCAFILFYFIFCSYGLKMIFVC